MITALIAEDELLVRLGIAGSVPWAGLNIALVGEAEDGLEAWEMYQKYHPDILIADIRMPGISGTELVRRIRAVDQRCSVILVTNVSEDSVLDEARQLGVAEILFKKTLKKDDISTAVRKVCETLQAGDGSLAAGKSEENPGRVRPEIRKVMEYIQANLAEDLSLERVSKFVGFDSAYFSKMFKTEVHINYSDYLCQMRMLRAGELLAETNDMIGAIAERCGFPNLPYFSARFRRFYGMTPREWREEKKMQPENWISD